MLVVSPETIIGDWLHTKGGRDRVVLATKVGAKLTEPGKPDIVGDLSAAYIVGQVEGSLRRLRTDYIDLYQSHFDDAATPIHETLEAFDRLIRAGKVRAIGASHYSPARLQEALSTSENAHNCPAITVFSRATIFAIERNSKARCNRRALRRSHRALLQRTRQGLSDRQVSQRSSAKRQHLGRTASSLW
jgi:aryl-alcohol dehydrogenase-like predicted oxidoreductase